MAFLGRRQRKLSDSSYNGLQRGAGSCLGTGANSINCRGCSVKIEAYLAPLRRH